MTEETIDAFQTRKNNWWRENVLATIFSAGNSYECWADRAQWFDPVYVPPVIVHMFGVAVVVYNPKATGKSQTSTYEPMALPGTEPQES
jgi:hypothetical protein